MAKSLDNVRTQTDKKWEQDLLLYKFETADSVCFRLVGDVFGFGRHWISTKPDDPQSGKNFPRDCPNFDPESEEFSLPNGCVACLAAKTAPDKTISTGRFYLINAINRDAQSDGKRNPIVALGPLPASVISDIIKLKKDNKPTRGATEGFHVTDPDRGCDILIRYDKNEKGNKKWHVSLDVNGRVPLTDEEKHYKLFNFDAVYHDFKDKDVVKEFNRETQRSLDRIGYFDTDSAEAEDADNAPRGRSLNTARQTGKQAATKDTDASTEDAEPAGVAGRKSVDVTPDLSKPKLNVVPSTAPASAKAAKGDPVCPHEDADHRYGDFQSDNTCFKCALRMDCIAATEAMRT